MASAKRTRQRANRKAANKSSTYRTREQRKAAERARVKSSD